jgi:hypothetical protein
MQVEIDEAQRQMILLALAHLSIERPGWDWALNQIAVLMDNVVNERGELYDRFRELRSSTKSLEEPDA